MAIKFTAKGWVKFAEEDIFNDGCIPESAARYSGTDYFEDETIDGLIKKLSEFVGNGDDKNILLDSCGENGRLDIQVYENEYGAPANKFDFDEWKKGARRLWLACYTFKIERVMTEEFSIADNVQNKDRYTIE